MLRQEAFGRDLLSWAQIRGQAFQDFAQLITFAAMWRQRGREGNRAVRPQTTARHVSHYHRCGVARMRAVFGKSSRVQPTVVPIRAPMPKLAAAARAPKSSWRSPLRHQDLVVNFATTAPAPNRPTAPTPRPSSSELRPSR